MCIREKQAILDPGQRDVISIKVSAQASGGPNWSVLEKKKKGKQTEAKTRFLA